MKKIICALILQLIAINANAAIIIYCPSSIECLEDDNINSCQFIGGDMRFWTPHIFGVHKGTYKFNYAFSRYHSKEGGVAQCFYFQPKPTQYKMELESRPEFNIEGLKIDGSSWMINESYKTMKCDRVLSSRMCPLAPYTTR